jgi:polyhydroxyalkanoate synthase subunit PhaC
MTAKASRSSPPDDPTVRSRTAPRAGSPPAAMDGGVDRNPAPHLNRWSADPVASWPVFAAMDVLRQAQGLALQAIGLGPDETPYQVLASGRRWRLRDYGGPRGAITLLIVAAPIKRPYVWDLSPAASAVRYCLRQRLNVHLLEWRPPSGEGGGGLAEHADQAIGEALAAISRQGGPIRPFLAGHSLGGTLAAIHAALSPQTVSGLVLLSAPLCFQPGVSRFRDALVAMSPPSLSTMALVPGSLLSQLSALASPETFVWSRLRDAAHSLADPRAREVLGRVERWALDEVALPGQLVQQLFEWLYRDNRLCAGTLRIGQRTVAPSCLRVPTLAVVNRADEIAPAASVLPFLAAMPGQDVRMLEAPQEVGVGLQHLAILVGRQAFARVWPEIISWLKARA